MKFNNKFLENLAYGILIFLVCFVIIYTLNYKANLIQHLSFRQKTNLNSNKIVEGFRFQKKNEKKLKDDDVLVLSYSPKVGPKFDHEDRKSFDCLMPYTVWELQSDGSWLAKRIGQVNKMIWGLKPSEQYLTCNIQTFSATGSIGSNDYYVTIGGFI